MRLGEVRQPAQHRPRPAGWCDGQAGDQPRWTEPGTAANHADGTAADSGRAEGHTDGLAAASAVLLERLGAAGRDLTLRILPLGRLWQVVRLLRQESWLTRAERFQAARLVGLQRREEWLCGRLALKWLALERLGLAGTAPLSDGPNGAAETVELARWLAAVEVQSRDGQGRAVRPRLSFRGRRLPWSVSLSHSRKTVAVCAADAASWRVGVDVVWLHELGGSSEEGTLRPTAPRSLDLWLRRDAVSRVRHWRDAVPCVRLSPSPCGGTGSAGCGSGETRSLASGSGGTRSLASGRASGPLDLCLTPTERQTREQAARAEAVAAVWAVKEAAYKAANSGQPFRPSAVVVAPASDGNRLWQWRWAGVDGVAAVERTGGDEAAAEVVAVALAAAAAPAPTGLRTTAQTG